MGTSTLIYALLSGVVTAVPLMLFAKGAIDIPLYLLGILQYLPPTMQFFIGIFVYGEQLSIQKTYFICDNLDCSYCILLFSNYFNEKTKYNK